MALDMFLKFETPEIKGESGDADAAFKDTVEVLSWSWGGTQNVSFSSGSGGGAGKANIQDLTISKYLDNASPQLQSAMIKGTHILKATLSVRKAGEAPYIYFKIIMDDVMVSSAQTGGSSGGDDRIIESYSFAFSKFSVEYYKQGHDGVVTAGPKYTYDVKGNKLT